MGGRGSQSQTSHNGSAPESYTLITGQEEQHRGHYPFLDRLQTPWHLISYPVGREANPTYSHTFGRRQPTLRWVHNDKVTDLYVFNMNTTQFLQATGLQLDCRQGGHLLSKRLSRILRPYPLSAFFSADAVRLSYLPDDPSTTQLWDGAGLISRDFLRRLPAKNNLLQAQQHHAQRVEFTIMTDQGQLKGHAIVVPNLRDEAGRPLDLLLPADHKKQVQLHGDQLFVGIHWVHGQSTMRLDVQSLINLHPFFSLEQLQQWLTDEGQQFVQSIETGEIQQRMVHLSPRITPSDLQQWPTREYLASGGHPLWFRHHVKSLFNRHLKGLNAQALTKLRLPIIGGRYYVMTQAVADRARLPAISVPSGHLHIDPQRETVWVNDEDWLALTDSPQGMGLAGILGGADHDDALWLHPFTDYDGTKQVLAWRSPNQTGEYILLTPTAHSDPLPWPTATGESLTYPAGDSRQLPARIDHTPVTPDPLTAISPRPTNANPSYTIEQMDTTIEQAVANRGALGMYCNTLMVHKALFGQAPAPLPAPLEQVIDSAMKTGEDLTPIVDWCHAQTQSIWTSRTPIPPLLQSRLVYDRQSTVTPPYTYHHWLADVEQMVRTHIQTMQQEQTRLLAKVQPPHILLEQGAVGEESQRLGAGLNKVYALALQQQQKGTFQNVWDYARHMATQYLSHFPAEQRPAIVRGALLSAYSHQKAKTDTAVWLTSGGARGGARGGVGRGAGEGTAPYTLRALRQLGLLAELIPTKVGWVAYVAGEQEAEML